MVQQARLDKGLWWDRAFRLISGCTKLSPGCDHCWSESESHMRSKQENKGIQYQFGHATDSKGNWNGRIRFLQNNLEIPIGIKKPTVFSIWNDMFHEDVDPFWVRMMFDVVKRTPRHRYLCLTKRPHIAVEMLNDNMFTHGDQFPHIPSNLWFGTTVEHEDYRDRLYDLAKLPAHLFISAEPLLGDPRLELDEFIGHAPCNHPGCLSHVSHPCEVCGRQAGKNAFQLVIVGGESGSKSRPSKIEWFRNLRDECKEEGVAFFMKQLGGHPNKRSRMSDFPSDLQIREMPEDLNI